MKFFIILRHWAEIFGLLPIFLAGLLKLHSTCPWEQFRERENVFQNIHFSNVFGQQTNFFRNLVGKNSTGLSKTKIAGPKEIFWTFFNKVILLIFLGPWPKVSRGFVGKISASLSKLNSHFQNKFWGEIFFSLQKFQFVTFVWKSSRKISANCRKKVSGAFKLLSTSPMEYFEECVFQNNLHLLLTFFGSILVIEQ